MSGPRSETSYRDRMVGEFRAADAGSRIRVVGWVHRRRDLGSLVFLDLRDRTGRLQLSLGPGWTPAPLLEQARRIGSEWVVAAAGTLERRPPEAVNPDLATGEVELHVTELDILSESETPPIPVAASAGDELPAEELRLRYRYLDLRRDALQHALITRHRVLQQVRRHLSGQGFLEIETPMLTRRTPEGARDYLVPSRVHPGEFYALPQSPQLYKQLLMVSGYDRYFQIARCLRDEDLRADRQPEFTQIDAEMSFVSEEDVFRAGEAMLAALWKEILDVDIAVPFPRLPFAEALERYGTDKPDLRLGMPFDDVTDLLGAVEFRLFADAVAAGDRIRAFRAPGGGSLSRRELDELAVIAQNAGAPGALWLRRSAEGLSGSFARVLDAQTGEALCRRTGLEPGDLLVVVMGRSGGESGGAPTPCDGALDALRRHLGARLELGGNGRHEWLWVTEFPMFDFEEETGGLIAMHHPFTMPNAEDVPALLEAAATPLDAGAARALHRKGLRSRAYDAVYNGSEMASGSIRIHDPALQRAVFRALGISDEEARAKFGFLLEAFRYGVPPHGGFAFGFDRLVMILVGATSLRDVIAYPKSTAARALFEGAPAPVGDADLRELHIRTVPPGPRTDPVG